ncbi:hypothetical protein [Actinophytocola glycyrrhizae]|uniref:Uncharacterized protein n=1 Tax=Actinophytocola glycyrrhizae TaxID=2044873 RepID=A0ABV9S6V5_9PSEU
MGTVSGLVRSAFGWHRPLMWFATFAAAVTVIAAIGLVVDDRMLVGAPIWAKPCKFAFSFGLYAATWAWMHSLQRRHVRLGWHLGTFAAVACALEVAVVFLQTIRGHRSHFNVATPFDTAMWTVMASSIAVLWVVNLVGTILLMREKHVDRPALLALRLGALITIAGMTVAFLMTWGTEEQRANRPMKIIGSHSVGVHDGGPSMPVTGWSTTGGDLRVPHFIGVHGLQLMPLFVVALGFLAAGAPRLRDELVRVRLVWTFGGLCTGLLALTAWQALRRQPLTSPDLLTIGVFGVLVAGTMVAATWALRARKSVPVRPSVPEEALV